MFESSPLKVTPAILTVLLDPYAAVSNSPVAFAALMVTASPLMIPANAADPMVNVAVLVAS